MPKPPYSLADKSGLIAFGNATAGVNMELMGKIIESQRDTQLAAADVAVDSQLTVYSKKVQESGIPDLDGKIFDEMFGDNFKNTTMKGMNSAAADIFNNRFDTVKSNLKIHAVNQAMVQSAQQDEAALKAGLEYWGNRWANSTDEIEFKNYESQIDTLIAHGKDKKLAGLNIPEMELQIKEEIKGKAQKAFYERGVENIRGQTQSIIDDAVVNGKDVAEAKKVAQKLILDAKTSGILTPKDTGSLNSNLNDYTAGKIKQDKDNKYAIDVKATQDLTHNLIKGVVTPNEVESLNLNKEMKAKWLGGDDNEGYLQNSYKPVPESTTPKGFKVVKDTIINAAEQKISTLNAYDALLQARYIDRSITDEDFKWAVNRLDNPYPKSLADMLDGAMAEHKEDIQSKWFSWHDDEDVKNINIQLFNFVDDELAKNPNKTFTPKELYEMKAQIGVTNAKPKDVRMQSAPAIELDIYWKNLDEDSKRQLWRIYEDPEKMKIALKRLKEKFPE
ncbi:MAG: hypothetical protein PHG53_09565 [Phycisphaerae bacterium]|nr:hypothetical protein [Phycisphaerae bacterium]